MKDKLRERLIAVASAVGYPIFYVFCLIIFASWTFPFEKVRDRIVLSFNESQRSSGSGRELAIADLGSSWVTGLKLTGVRITDHDAAHAAGKPDTKEEIKLDTVVARIELLPLLIGNHNIDFHAEAFGGKLDGVVKDGSKGQSFELTLDAIDLGQLTPLTDVLEAPMEGMLGGSIKVELPDDKMSKANGSVSLEASDVAIGDGKAQLMGKLAVPRISLGTFSLTGEIKEGSLKISKLGASGKDVDLLADGRINLRDQIADSFSDLNVRFRVSDTYRGKSDSTKAIFGAPGSTVPGLIELDPKMKQSKRADGFFLWHGRGPLGRLDFSPGGTGGPASGPGAGGAAPASSSAPPFRGAKGNP